MVPEVGLEPTLAEANTALNRARLPIPPLRQRRNWMLAGGSQGRQAEVSHSAFEPFDLRASRPPVLVLALGHVIRCRAVARRLHVAALCTLLALAGITRFVGLDHHLRRGAPEIDERNNFVDPVLRMWSEGTADPTVYAGYAGLFNHLAFLPIGLGQRIGGHVGAYLAGRALVACFSVANVALAYVLGRGVLGAPFGLFSAALLLVSRADIRSAQRIAPDVLVASAVLASLLLLARRPRHAPLWLGLLTGLATAVKYTGLLVAVLAGIGILLGPEERRLRRLASYTLAAMLVFGVAAPYAVLGLSHSAFGMGQQGAGFANALGDYYGAQAGDNRFLRGESSSLREVGTQVLTSLGPVGCVLAVLSLLAPAPLRRLTLPAAALCAASFVVMIPANRVFPRHFVPALAGGAFLAATGLHVLVSRLRGGRLRRLAIVLVAGPALALPAVESASLVVRAWQPAAVDLAAEWIERSLPGPALIATSLDGLRLDPSRFEVRYLDTLPELPPAVLAQYDLLVARTAAELPALRGLVPVLTLPPEDGDPRRPLTILRPLGSRPAALSPERYLPAPPPLDGSRSRALDLRFQGPVRISRVEVEVSAETRWPLAIELTATKDGLRFEPVASEPLRPVRPNRQRIGAPHGQTFALLDPKAIVGLRVALPETAFVLTLVRTFGTSEDGGQTVLAERRPRPE
jgi:hypothetical protein